MNGELDRLYNVYHDMLFQYLFYMVRNRDAAEELIQVVYLKVLNSYHAFKGKKSEKTWLYSVAKHVAIDWIRKNENRGKKRWGWQLSDLGGEIEMEELTLLPEEILAQGEEMQQVYKALKRCTVDQQQVIVFRYIQSLSLAETAEVLGWSELKVKITQQRAMKNINQTLGKINYHGVLREVSE